MNTAVEHDKNEVVNRKGYEKGLFNDRPWLEPMVTYCEIDPEKQTPMLFEPNIGICYQDIFENAL